MSFSPQHILVPVAIDTDEDLHLAKHALFAACDIADKFHSKITLLHLAPMLTPGSSATVDFSGRIYHSFIQVLQERLRHSQKTLEDLKQLALLRGLTVEGRVVESLERTGSVIVDSAQEVQADLIILGSHGRSGLSKVLFGSVATSVSDAAPMPVLLLHPIKEMQASKK